MMPKSKVRSLMTFVIAAAAPLAVCAEFKMDRSAMSDAYWKIWNDDEQAKIDADIEKHRKADATVAIPAADGTEVSVEQIGHDFKFVYRAFRAVPNAHFQICF